MSEHAIVMLVIGGIGGATLALPLGLFLLALITRANDDAARGKF